MHRSPEHPSATPRPARRGSWGAAPVPAPAPAPRPAGRRWLARAAATLAALATLAAPAGADAAARTFANSYAQTLHGDIALIGNANSTCRAAWSGGCTPNALGNGNSNNSYGALVDVDGIATTTNSSSSTLALPAGAVVRSARLIWGSAGDGTDNNGEGAISFDTPATAGIAYTTIGTTPASTCGSLANLSGSNTRGFACSADVTALVQAAGNGAYTLGGIEQRPNTAAILPDHWSGWGLYVVYELASEPLRRLVLADGFQRVGAGAPTTITANGFVAPAAGTVTARLSYMVGEGDSEISGDNATFGSRTLDTAATPNLMNSSIRGLDYQSTKNPNYVNHYGFDIHSDEINGAIANGATSANFSFTSTQDVYYPFALGIAIDLGEPDLVLNKTLSDVNGGSVEPGDIIEYQIVATNTGNDGAAQVTVTDPIPADTTYVAGSMQITAGAGAGTKTDAANDDQGTFAGNQVTMRLGTGATATAGGVLAANGGSSTMRFRVRIDNDADEGVPLVNTASGSYIGQTSLLGYADPSSVAATPVRRADMVVTQTPSAALTAGQAGSLTLTASNIGGASTHGQPVTVQTTLPAGVTFGSITSQVGWTCSTASLPTITCTRTDALAGGAAYPDIVVALTPNQTATSVTFTSQVSGGNEVRTDNDTDADTVTIQRSANLRLTKSVSATTARVGDTLTYTLTAANLGPSNTTGVVVSDPLPAGLQPLSATTTAGSCSTTGQTVGCPVGALASGSSGTITITARLLAATAGTSVVNGASIAGADPDPAPGNDSATATTAVDQAADVRVTKSVAPAAQNPGGDVTWTVTVRNNGPGTATGISLTDDLPAGITVQSITASQGSCGTGDPFTCTIGTLANGATATVTVAARPGLSTAGTNITNTATATTTSLDPDTNDNTGGSQLTVNPAADLRVVKTADKPTANVDEDITWSVALTNLGPSPATGVTLTDTAPAGVAIQSVAPPAGVTCSTTGQTIACSTASLAAGTTRTVTIVGRVARSSAGSPLSNSATGASSTFDPDTSNNLSTATTNVNAAADLRVSKSVDRATADVGDTITWTVTARNDGASPATGVVLTDVLPAGVTLLTRVASQGTCSVSSGQVICNVGGLAVNASATLTLTARVERAAAETPVQNVAQITGAQFDPDTANNSTNVTTTVGPSTDLQLTKSVDRATANVGDTLTYTLIARNDGPSTATGVTITDTLPAGFTASGTPTVTGGTCSITGQTLTCTVASLSSGGVRSVSVPGTIGPAAAGTTISNTAAITGGQPDPDPANNTSAAANTSVAGVANLAITKTVDRATANVGDTLTYTLTVANSGPQAATGVTVTDTLPAGVSRLGAAPSSGSCPAGSPIVCTLGTIPAGGSATVTITARVNVGAANGTATNSATVDADQDDLTPGNDTATASTTIAPAADLQIVKTADRTTANVGETVTWTLVAANNGPQSATGVTITDTIPSGITLQQPITGLPFGVSCTVAAGVVSCPVSGAIASGSAVTITLRGTVQRAAAETPQQNVATVAGSQTDPDTANNSSAVTTSVNAAADLAVTKTVDRAAADVGDTLTWTVGVTNTGPSAATGVQLIDDLPAGVTLLSQSVTGGGSCAAAPTQVICNVGTLASGASATATITARVERANAESPVNNTARATATQFDPDTANNLATASTTVGPATDLRMGKTANRATANVGDTIRYTLTATNDGPSAASGVVVTDTLPGTLLRTGAIVASQGTCAQSGQTITCTVGALASGATATMTLDAVTQPSAAGTTVANSATVAGAQLDPDLANNASATASTAVALAADLDLDLSVDRATANVGDTLNYGFTLTNRGPSTSSAITLTPTLPADVQIISSSVSGLTCAGSPVPTCTGALANGATATGTLVARVLPAASGSTVNASGTVTATTYDPIPANNADNVATTIAPAADLQLTKSVDRATANIGDLLTYTLVGSNNGPAAATGVTIADTLPSTLAVVGTPTSTQGTCAVAGQTVTCSPGSIANAATVTVTIVARVQPSAAAQTVGNTATIDGDQHDPTPANDTALTTSTAVGAAADLQVTQSVASPTVNVGGTATWTVRVRNNGPQTATSVALTDDLPAGVAVDSITPSQGSCGTGDPFSCALGMLASGAEATVTIVGRITGAAETAFANSASATATQFDPNASNNSATAAVSTNPAADLHIDKVADRATADVGETITWTVTARNDGPSAATGVVITDAAPSGVSLQTPTGLPAGVTCSVAGQVVTCARSGSLASGAQIAITLRGTVNLAAAGTPLQNSATVAADQFDPDTADNLSAVTTNVNAAADLRISKTVDRGTANVGDTLTWTVVATNDGPSTATGVVVTDVLPSGVTLLTRASTQGSCAPSGPQVICTIGTLTSGASATITLAARVERAAAESPVDNTASVTSSVFDPDTADNLSTASTAVGPAADLRLSKSVDRATADVGDTLTYTLTATNDGPSNATGATITDTLPSGLQLTATPTASQGACTVVGQTVTCSLGTIGDGATATVTIQARVRPNASSSTLGNVATITGTRPDPDPSNDSSGPPVTTTIAASADLVVTHTATPPVVNVGNTADWTITVRNDGPDTATGVQLSDDLPAGTTLISRTTSQGTCAASGDPLVCSLGTLASGAMATITVRLRIDAGASATFTAAATASATQHDPTPSDNTASAGVSTSAAADLSLTKVADRPTADVGQQITWTLTATNDGPSAATGVVIADTVPAGVTGVTATGGAGVTCSVVGQAVSCSVVGSLASGASRTVTLRGTVARSSAGSPLANSASVAGTEFDPDPSDNVSTATTDVSDAADLRVRKTADRGTAAVGDTITWTIDATNDGPSPAAGAVVTDDLPTGVTLLTATATQGTCNTVGPQVSCALGGIASGQTATATLTARVEAIAAETPLANTARVTSATFDPDTANNLSTVTTSVGQSIDLTTSAVVSRTTANVGDELLYTFTVANAGPSTATGTTFTHALPADTTYVTSTSTQGGCAVAGSTLTCNLGSLAASGDATVTVRVSIDEPAAGTTINARGTVTAVQLDRNPANDQSPIVSTAVAPAADLLVTVSADQPSTTVGGTVTYLVTVTNDGPSAATGVTLSNQLPAGATITSVTPSQGTCTTGDPRSCALGSLAPNATATLTVVARAESANAGGLMTNRATVTATQFDPRTANNADEASSAVGDAADLEVTKAVDRTAAEIGDTVTWTLTARNRGPLGATGVAVTDAIPAGVTVTSASSSTSGVTCTTGAPVTCAVGALANGATATITVVGTIGRAAAGQPITGQATITGDQLDPDPSNNVSASTTTVGPAADLRVTKVVDDPAPGIGDAVTWTIQVFNDGPNAASAVQVTDVVPAGAPIDAVSSSAGSCTRTGQSVTCALGSIPSGGSATVTIRATVATGAGGVVLDNAATASAATRDPDTANNTATARAIAGAAADLEVSVAPDRSSAVVGERVAWTAVVGNAGPQTATGGVVSFALPDGVVDPSASVVGGGGNCTVSGRTVTCTIPDLAPGASATLALTGTVGRAGAERSLAVDATVAGTLPDPVPANNTARAAVITVPAAVDLVVTKRTDKPSAGVGETVTITTDVLNRGPSTATDVTLTDAIPPGVRLVSITPSQGTCTVVDRTINCNLGSLADGEAATVTVVVVIEDEGVDQSLLNAGQAGSGQFDTDGANNADVIRTAGVGGGPKPLIKLTKVVDKTAVAAGDAVVWTLTATNTGRVDATGVRITDQLPAGLDYVSTKAIGATCTRFARTITCVVSRLTPGRTVTIKVTTRVAITGTPIDNTAYVTAAELPDPKGAGQVAGARVRATGAPFIVAGIKPLEDYTRPGRRVRIAVKVTNVGQATANDVRACFTLPSSVVLLRRPTGFTQKGAQFCLRAPNLATGKYKRIVLSARVVGGAGAARPALTGSAANSRVKVERYPIVVRGPRPTRGAGVTG